MWGGVCATIHSEARGVLTEEVLFQKIQGQRVINLESDHAELLWGY